MNLRTRTSIPIYVALQAICSPTFNFSDQNLQINFFHLIDPLDELDEVLVVLVGVVDRLVRPLQGLLGPGVGEQAPVVGQEGLGGVAAGEGLENKINIPNK